MKQRGKERGREKDRAGAYRTADFPWAIYPVELRIELLFHLLLFFK